MRTTPLFNRCAFLFFITTLFFSCQHADSDSPSSDAANQVLFEAIPASTTNIFFNAGGSMLYPNDPTGLYSNISGMAAGDINNDGLPDLFFSGGPGNSKLYLNKGNFQFEDITSSAGIVDKGVNNADNQGVNFVDINGDGWLDIYILKTGITGNFSTGQFNKDGANLLYINQKDNTFKEEAAQYGLDIIGLSHTANFFDYDGDGDLDVYLIHTGEPGAAFNFSYYEAPPRSKWLNDQFLENQNGVFVDVREKAGFPSKRSIGLSVAVADVNKDGFQDIYVANDFFGPDFFYLNNGDKTFSDQLSKYFTKTPMSAMGSDFADINNDGWLDLFVGEMMPATQKRQKLNLVPFSIEIYNKLEQQGNPQYTRNMLQLNKQGKAFRDIGLLAGVYATEWSWSSFFFDADNDGFKDLFVANGILRDMTNMDFVKKNFGDDYTTMADPEYKSKANPNEAPSVAIKNYLFRNQDGYRFSDQTDQWGLNQPYHTRGATYADLDADGDLDLIVNNLKNSPAIYRNRSEQVLDRAYLRLRLVGKGQNSFGIGALVTLFSDGQQQSGYLSTQRGFQSCPEPVLHFGLGQQTTIDTLLITWPGGQQEAWFDVATNQLLELTQGTGTAFQANTTTKPLLQEQASFLKYNHREQAYSDFKRERLLIRGYANEGPGMAVADVNGDGLDDCFIGGASGYPGQLLLQQEDGNWKSGPGQPWNNLRDSEHMGAIFFDANADGSPDLYLASGSNELAGKPAALQDQLYLNDGQGNFTSSSQILPDGFSSIVTAADFDGDGDQDVFVGGRNTPGDYSEIPNSSLLINNNGSFEDVTEQIAPELRKAGRITSAIWTDADTDGDLDLAVVGEWMPLTFFLQEKGRFEVKAMEGSEGWWNSILGADLDNDGDMDYIAGNHGLNSIFQASRQEPISLLTGDLDQNGQSDPLVFQYTDGVNAPFVNRDIFTSQMPAYNNQYYSFSKYASANFESIVTEELRSKVSVQEVYELRSSVFINQGNGAFEQRALPTIAQTAPVYGLLAQDVDEDGNLDLIISGNTYSNHYEYGSMDALGGALLWGKGDGTFRSDPAKDPGFDLLKAGRSLSLMYHAASARPYLLASNNDGPLQAFKWDTDAVIIDVPSNATHAVASMKDGSEQRWEFYTGGGYLSQSFRKMILTKAMEKITFYQGAEPL